MRSSGRGKGIQRREREEVKKWEIGKTVGRVVRVKVDEREKGEERGSEER